MDNKGCTVVLKQIWSFKLFPFRVGIYNSSECISSEIGDLLREHLALIQDIIEERKNRKNGFYNIWSNGTLRCLSRLLYLECSLLYYLWLHSLICGLFLFVLVHSSPLWKDLYFFFLYELSGIHFKGLLILMVFTCFGTSLQRGMILRCFLQFMVYRSYSLICFLCKLAVARCLPVSACSYTSSEVWGCSEP